MAVGGEFLDLGRQAYAARPVAFQLEGLGHHRHRLPGVKALGLRRHRAGKTFGGEGIDFRAADAVFFRQVLRGAAHGDPGGGVEQRLPQKVLELDLAHAKAAAVGVGSHRVARHRFGAHAQRQRALPQGDAVGGLADQLEAGAADPLHVDGRHFDRHAGVQADVARQHVSVETGLRHAAGEHCVDVMRGEPGTLEHLARRLDAQVDRRHHAEHAVVVGEGGAHAGQQPDVVVVAGDAFGIHRGASSKNSARGQGARAGWIMVMARSPQRALRQGAADVICRFSSLCPGETGSCALWLRARSARCRRSAIR